MNAKSSQASAQGAHARRGTVSKALLAGLGGLALLCAAGPARAAGCAEPQAGTKDIPILSPPLASTVIGAGRLPFYAAPDSRCRMDGVFVVPKDELVVYARTSDGWSSVMYLNPRTGADVSGWVRSDRLKMRGTVGPRQ